MPLDRKKSLAFTFYENVTIFKPNLFFCQQIKFGLNETKVYEVNNLQGSTEFPLHRLVLVKGQAKTKLRSR